MRIHAHSLLSAVCAAALAAGGARVAVAQNIVLAPAASISAGAFFPPSGNDAAPLLALRGTRALNRVALLEAGIMAAFPQQQLGGRRMTFLAPELQIQFQAALGSLTPYFGFGGGTVLEIAGEQYGGTDLELTMSAALGLRAALAERIGFQADARLRGIGAGFERSASELSAGLLWRLGR